MRHDAAAIFAAARCRRDIRRGTRPNAPPPPPPQTTPLLLPSPSLHSLWPCLVHPPTPCPPDIIPSFHPLARLMSPRPSPRDLSPADLANEKMVESPLAPFIWSKVLCLPPRIRTSRAPAPPHLSFSRARAQAADLEMMPHWRSRCRKAAAPRRGTVPVTRSAPSSWGSRARDALASTPLPLPPALASMRSRPNAPSPRRPTAWRWSGRTRCRCNRRRRSRRWSTTTSISRR